MSACAAAVTATGTSRRCVWIPAAKARYDRRNAGQLRAGKRGGHQNYQEPADKSVYQRGFADSHHGPGNPGSP